jgi:hypothetical protein
MKRRPLHFITREREWTLMQQLETIIDVTAVDHQSTAVIMVSPDYSATLAMHLAHAWSSNGEMLDIIPVNVPYPDESADPYVTEFQLLINTLQKYRRLILVEAGIIRGGNWAWLLEQLTQTAGFDRQQITLVALVENLHSAVKSDYVAEYYDDHTHELMFYFEKYNKHWPIK